MIRMHKVDRQIQRIAHVAIWKEKLAAAMHATFRELPFATAAVCIRQDSAAMRHFVLELALVAGAAGIEQSAFSLAAAIDEFPLVLNASGEK